MSNIIIWQSSENNLWYVNILGSNIPFSTQEEAVKMAQKLEMAKAVISAVQSLALVTDTALDLTAEYFDAGTITDDDVAPLGITAATLASCITLLQQVENLMVGSATSLAIYRTTLNQVRRIVV